MTYLDRSVYLWSKAFLLILQSEYDLKFRLKENVELGSTTRSHAQEGFREFLAYK